MMIPASVSFDEGFPGVFGREREGDGVGRGIEGDEEGRRTIQGECDEALLRCPVGLEGLFTMPVDLFVS